MIINNGLVNELRIIQALNKKRYKSLTTSCKNIIKKLYGDIKFHKLIYCEKCGQFDKPDMKITYKGEAKYVSIKCNSARVVHSCYLKNFIMFLEKFDISSQTIKTILLFHYGDGTLNGTGATRLDYNQIMLKMKTQLELANRELNANKKLVKAFVNVCLFDGMHNECAKADYIYYGDYECGYICSKEEIDNFINIKNFNYFKTLHIGPIVIHPYARYINFENTSPSKRHMIQCDWPNLSRDIYYINNKYNY